ncbi:MAG TPA: SRPBCC domain-containing protein [Candidatus Acidoferrales bacterium]|nr:SRPBCC domain-containing protein [Candidatus Acidoferrales bacterium]
MNTAPKANSETEFELLLVSASPRSQEEAESPQNRDRDIEFELLLAAASFFELGLQSRSLQKTPEPLIASSEPAAEDSLAKLAPIYRLDFDREYAESLHRVWLAISDEAEVSKWMQYPVKLELQVGGAIRVDFAPDEPLEGIICALCAPKHLAYLWGDSFVRWELDGDARATRLRLSHIGVRPELVVALGAGWHAFLDQLEDHFTGASRPDRYVDLTERYEAVLRPQLARRP